MLYFHSGLNLGLASALASALAGGRVLDGDLLGFILGSAPLLLLPELQFLQVHGLPHCLVRGTTNFAIRVISWMVPIAIRTA